ncbi:MAG: hypothetical protein WD604_15455 [Balneolaceae bacterium]
MVFTLHRRAYSKRWADARRKFMMKGNPSIYPVANPTELFGQIIVHSGRPCRDSAGRHLINPRHECLGYYGSSLRE